MLKMKVTELDSQARLKAHLNSAKQIKLEHIFRLDNIWKLSLTNSMLRLGRLVYSPRFLEDLTMTFNEKETITNHCHCSKMSCSN